MDLRLTLVGLSCAIVWTQASAEDKSTTQLRHGRHFAAMAKMGKSGDLNATRFGDIHFSDPYAPPVGMRKKNAVQFPAPESVSPVDPKGGISLSAGRDSPGAPFTGGLKLRF